MKPLETADSTPLLLVDDDRAYRQVYRGLLAQEGYAVTEAVDRPSVLQAVRTGAFAVVLLDLMLPPDGTVAAGLAQLREVLSIRPETKVIVVSGAGDVTHMVQAVRAGAYDFLTKPVDPDVLLIVVQRARARYDLEQRIASLQESLARTAPSGAMLGQSPGFTNALQLAERVAASDLPVLVTGESGTGKELMARAIHAASPRAARPFVAVNCGAVPETLFEATMFGHVKGAFSAAGTERTRGEAGDAPGQARRSGASRGGAGARAIPWQSHASGRGARVVSAGIAEQDESVRPGVGKWPSCGASLGIRGTCVAHAVAAARRSGSTVGPISA